MTSPQDIDATLSERGSRYGKFTGLAQIAQDLKAVLHATPNWESLPPDMKEAMEMTMVKYARVLNDGGDPFHHDQWHDVVGYNKLVADRLATGHER